jgi:hypothetical protein
LAYAVLGLTPRYLIWVLEKRGRFGDSMPILSQASLPILGVQLRIEISDHLARNPFILDVRIAVREAAPLFPDLVERHLDFSSTLNEFLQVFSH